MLSIPVLMQQGYKILYDGDDWALITPKGAIVDLETEKTGVTRGFPFLDMRKFKEGFTMIKTIQGNMEGRVSPRGRFWPRSWPVKRKV